MQLDAGNYKARYRRAHAYAGEGSHDLALLDMQAGLKGGVVDVWGVCACVCV